MTNEQTATQDVEALVLKDTDGNYYIFDGEAFERARVTDDALRSSLDQRGDDSQGFTVAPLFAAPSGHTLPSIVYGSIRAIPPYPPQTGLIGSVSQSEVMTMPNYVTSAPPGLRNRG